MAGEERDRDTVEAEEDRRHRWSELPRTMENEEMTMSQPSSPPPPDLVDDADRVFFVRHAG